MPPPEGIEPPARRKRWRWRWRWGAIGTVTQEGLRQARRLVIFVVGATVLLIGALLLVLPGPGIPIVIGGLAILAVEFAWARRWLRRGKVTTKVVKRSLLRRLRRRKSP